MKFTLAWANVLQENVALRLALVCLTITSLGLGAISIRLALEPPLLIERGCVTSTIDPAKSTRSEAELKRFVSFVLPIRLDSSAQDVRTFLSDKELQSREAEQMDLKRKNITQRLLMNEVHVGPEGLIIASADRLVSIGNIRSVLPVQFRVRVTPVARTEANPYGLQLSSVEVAQLESERNQSRKEEK